MTFSLIIFLKYTRKKLIIRFIIFIPVVTLITFFIIRFKVEVGIFFSELLYSRLGIITYTLPDFIKDFSFDTFFGVGTDLGVVFKKIIHFQNPPLIFIWDGSAVALADVYWVALLIYHGIVGFLLLFSSFFFLFRYCLKVQYLNNINYDYLFIVKSLFLMIIILALFNQVLVVREFALGFWIIIGVVSNQIANRILPQEGHDLFSKTFKSKS
jgi:hypothetical protein